jgi:hypothetical protein
MLRRLAVVRFYGSARPIALGRCYGSKSKPATPEANSEEGKEIAAARKWLDAMTPETIPRSICDVTFSRSSGPGGQNVNKYGGPVHRDENARRPDC